MLFIRYGWRKFLYVVKRNMVNYRNFRPAETVKIAG